jgi:tetrapyrrole methylase family protein / MazG family protein
MRKNESGSARSPRKGRRAGLKRGVEDLLTIMAKLRGEGGCPWDKEQDEQSLKRFLIEEAYETVEAIETGTPDALKEELGDVLLQIVFLSRIAEEKNQFAFADVVDTLAEKLIHRHPHVFEPTHEALKGMAPKNAQEVLNIWGAAKRIEGKYAGRKSLLDGIPLALPALERARRISQRAARVGLDVLRSGMPGPEIERDLEAVSKVAKKNRTKLLEERLGDALLRLTDWGRLRNISAEEALRKANRRFGLRFRRFEGELLKSGKGPEDSTPGDVERFWGRAGKAKEKNSPS